jgi:hypothetical protein
MSDKKKNKNNKENSTADVSNDNIKVSEKKNSDRINKNVSDDSKVKKKKKNGLINEDPKPFKKIKPPPPSDVNPMIRILDQHREHKLRIAKVCASIFLVLVVLLMFFFYMSQYTDHRKHDNKVSAKTKKLEIIDKRIANSTGYEQDQAIMKAIAQTYRIQKEDYEHPKKWKKVRKEYLET